MGFEEEVGMGDKAPRYALILETINGDKYYFDVNVDRGSFIKLEKGKKPVKTALQVLDHLTASLANKEELGRKYKINDQVARVYVTYQYKGENKIAPIFNNEEWAKVAASCTEKKVDFGIELNNKIFNRIYCEIANLDSGFGQLVIDNPDKKINVSDKTVSTIVNLRAHEKAIRMKQQFMYQVQAGSYAQVSNEYKQLKRDYYKELKKRLSSYRELRTLYFSYLKYKYPNKMVPKKQNKPVKTEEPKQQSIPIKPTYQEPVTHQMTFDELERMEDMKQILQEFEEMKKELREIENSSLDVEKRGLDVIIKRLLKVADEDLKR